MSVLATNLLVYSNKTKKNNEIILQGKTKNLRKIKKPKKLKYLIRKRKTNAKECDSRTNYQNCFFSPKRLPDRTPLENNIVIVLGAYSDADQTNQIYKSYIASTPDKYKFKLYNKLFAKIQSYQLIDTDQGANFEFSPNKFTKVVGTLLNLVYVLPIPILPAIIAGTGQFALKVASDKRKVNKTKNKLAHCIPDENFIKLLSILLAKFHEADFSKQKNIDSFLEKKFQAFWSIFKKQAKENPNTENLIQFWSGCLFEYFKQQATLADDAIKKPVEARITTQSVNQQHTNTQKIQFYAIPQAASLQHPTAVFFKPNNNQNMPIPTKHHSIMYAVSRLLPGLL